MQCARPKTPANKRRRNHGATGGERGGPEGGCIIHTHPLLRPSPIRRLPASPSPDRPLPRMEMAVERSVFHLWHGYIGPTIRDGLGALEQPSASGAESGTCCHDPSITNSITSDMALSSVFPCSHRELLRKRRASRRDNFGPVGSASRLSTDYLMLRVACAGRG